MRLAAARVASPEVLDLAHDARDNPLVHIIGPDNQKLAIVMVGLPARGKSYTARRIERYLSWLGYRTRVFNVGQYRRVRVGAQMPHDFFDPNNPKQMITRLRRLFLRTRMDRLEMNLLRGVLSTVQKRVKERP